jgi:integrase
MTRGASGIKFLIKRHNRTCLNDGDPARCDCAWKGKYNGFEVVLAVWANQSVDPRTKKHAGVVLARFIAAVDDGSFSPDGEQRSLGSEQRLSDFITEWKTHHAEKFKLRSTSRDPMLGVLSKGLGRCSLQYLAAHPRRIDRWLVTAQKQRRWSTNTWCRYHELLHTLFARAIEWKRLSVNPMASVEKLVGSKKKFGVRIEEDVEDRLFAACDLLNRPQHQPNRSSLTQAKADAIRERAAAGETQVALAREFSVSAATICQVVKGDVWNPDRVRVGTKGTEMRRRLIAAFDGGLRAGEMLEVQLKHVEKRPLVVVDPDGTRREVLRIALPAEITKGGATTGEIEYVYAATDRFKQVLTERRFALKDPEAYVFGTEDGRRQQGFRRMWRELFRLAGLTGFGRRQGLVWHTTRHEFISRHAENTGDPVLTQELARHRNLETTQGYFHARSSRILQAALRLERR